MISDRGNVRIVKYGEPVLEKPAEAVTEFDTPELHKLVDDMFESMYAAKRSRPGRAANRHRQAHRGDRVSTRRRPPAERSC